MTNVMTKSHTFISEIGVFVPVFNNIIARVDLKIDFQSDCVRQEMRTHLNRPFKVTIMKETLFHLFPEQFSTTERKLVEADGLLASAFQFAAAYARCA